MSIWKNGGYSGNYQQFWDNEKGDSGHLDTGRLSRWRGFLLLDAAAKNLGVLYEFAKSEGAEFFVSGTYRSYEEQVKVKAAKPTLAATPGRSIHGWGRAMDIGVVEDGKQRAITYDSPTYQWMLNNAPKYGWVNPPWAVQGGSSKPEPWHWEYVGLPNEKKFNQAFSGDPTSSPESPTSSTNDPLGNTGWDAGTSTFSVPIDYGSDSYFKFIDSILQNRQSDPFSRTAGQQTNSSSNYETRQISEPTISRDIILIDTRNGEGGNLDRKTKTLSTSNHNPLTNWEGRTSNDFELNTDMQLDDTNARQGDKYLLIENHFTAMKIAPKNYGKYLAPMQEFLPKFGIDTKTRLFSFLCQTAHESAGFAYAREAGYLGSEDAAVRGLQKQYPNRCQDCGPVENYRCYGPHAEWSGRGLIQLTWKYNYISFTKWYNQKFSANEDFVRTPQLLSDSPKFAVLSALYFWTAARRLNELSDRLDPNSPALSSRNFTAFEDVTQGINGGTNGLQARANYWNRLVGAFSPKTGA